MRVISLGSGSTGNALLVEAGPQGRTKILVDAGLNGRLLTGRLHHSGVLPTQLQGVLVTHEHSDHIIGLPWLMKRYAVPAVANHETLEAIENTFASGVWRTDTGSIYKGFPSISNRELDAEEAELQQETLETTSAAFNDIWQGSKLRYTTSFNTGSAHLIGDLEVLSFSVSHDAVAPCGYLLSAGGCRVCIAIDTGEITPAMLEMMALADLLIIESNHDRQRLLNGPYHYAVKQRILSNKGHLSNDQAAEAILHTWRTDSVRWVWLAHLSRINNTPELALDIMRDHIELAKANPAQLHLTALPPGMGNVWDSTQLWHMPELWEMQR